jgi:hypothetical protein
MRSYKKLKKYNGVLSKNNKGLLIIHTSNPFSIFSKTITCTLQNPDETTSNLAIVLFPVIDSSTGLPFNTPSGNCWSMVPFNVIALSGNTSDTNIYELF